MSSLPHFYPRNLPPTLSSFCALFATLQTQIFTKLTKPSKHSCPFSSMMIITSLITSPLSLPLLTSLIGLGGFTVGIFSFINPIAAARIYGVPVHAPHTASSHLTSILSPSKPASTSSSNHPATSISSRDVSYIHALGIRNFTAGLSIIAMTGYWHFTLADESALVRLAVQRALGIVILVGSLVPVVDAWVCWGHSSTISRPVVGGAGEAEAKDAGGEAAADAESRAYAAETGRRARTLHAMRSLIWMAGGLWCLYG